MSANLMVIWKNIGETPLECMNRAKTSRPDLANLPMTYAGRLDPMAEGLILMLVGDECKNKDKYLKLDKVYEFQILIGFRTDTYDVLGLITSPEIAFERSSDLPAEDFDRRGQTVSKAISGFATTLQSFIGTFIQKYPSFSSKTVNGKQLFELSRENNLPENLPEHEVTIYSLKLIKDEIIEKDKLKNEILRRIAYVNGDFRQKEIIKKWEKAFEESTDENYTILHCIAECSSGTYIRQLVADLGSRLEVLMVTYAITRTKIGDYDKITH